MKKGTARYGFVTFSGAAVSTIVVDLEDGTITATSTAGTIVSQKVEDYGSGWYRISVTALGIAATAGFALQFGSAGSATPSYTGNIPSFEGSTSNHLYAYGAQLEAGAYPTTYIPTTSSSATRVADECSKTGISSLIGQTEGVLFLDFDFTNIGGTQVLLSIHDNAANKRLEIWANNDLIYGFIGGSVNINIANTAIANGRHKVALAYKSTDSAFYVDGVQIGTSVTAFTIAALTALSYAQYTGLLKPDEKVSQTLLFPTRLTNAELASLTTI